MYDLETQASKKIVVSFGMLLLFRPPGLARDTYYIASTWNATLYNKTTGAEFHSLHVYYMYMYNVMCIILHVC
jgi:hypothetical protein